MVKRKIPSTMVSQHPDHAGKPFWHHKEFISTHHEAEECFLSFSKLGVSEYKWDWEGKLVDESVFERLLGEHFSFFKKNELGKEKFLTFRLPNIRVQTEFRLGRAFMVMLSAAGLAKQVGLHSPPLFEVILPMTETAGEMIGIQEAFKEIASLKHHLHNLANGTLKHIQVIPLFEQIKVMMNSDKVLEEYLTLHQQRFGFKPDYLRPYVARSDPALNSGLVPTVLAIKIALSGYKKLETKAGVKLYPIIGSASLPFRGGLTPNSVEQFVNEYKGIKTALLQSAFRYDYELPKVKKAISKIESMLSKGVAENISNSEEERLRKIIAVFEKYYQQTIENIASEVNKIATYLPRRRERVQHIGLFGYSRSVGKISLPRAIGFTGAMYSLGIPPELIGTGRGLKATEKLGLLEVMEKYYVNLKSDLQLAGGFLNKKTLEENPLFESIFQDISEIEKYLGFPLEPQTEEQKEHQKFSSLIHKKLRFGQDITELVKKMAVLRKSVG